MRQNAVAATVPLYRKHTSIWKKLWQCRVLYLLLLPALVYFCLFRYAPMFGLVIAFKRYNLLLGFWGSPWVGLENFRHFVEGVYFWNIIGNTLIISLNKLLLGFSAPIILALLLNEVRVSWFKRMVQTVTYLPHFISWVIVYGLLVALLAPGDGFVNQLLMEYGFDPVNFLTEVNWVRPLIYISDIWKEVGWGAILYLAALAGIDPHLYEAARMDGASRLRQLWHVTLPGIRNVIMILLILRMGSILDAGFDQIFILANSFNQEKADIIDTWVYRQGIERLQIGLATAVGLFKSVIGTLLLVGANQLAKRFDGQIW
ncbi:MAG: sugar transporter ATPase [Paenibacillaceae bacterium]|jgi:putative aldouronate transport system permease protein|nr:sugar transporter ATPase [Paenibacillaceae bacterium]